MVNDNFKNKRIAASQSFAPEEVNLLDLLIKKVLSGSDAKLLLRSPTAILVMRKIQSMKMRVDTLKLEEANASRMEETSGE